MGIESPTAKPRNNHALPLGYACIDIFMLYLVYGPIPTVFWK